MQRIEFVATLAGGKPIAIGDDEMTVKILIPLNQIPSALDVIGLMNSTFRVTIERVG